MSKEEESRRGGNAAIIELTEYTDPYCTWCWGSEPILRRIRETYGNQIRIGFRMGGLVEDIGNFYDPSNRIGGPNWYKQVAAHWLDASQMHGMPVDEGVFYELKDEMRSTFPASIAYKAAEFQSVELAQRFLRRMREGAAAERRPIHRLDVQAELAEEVGLDRNQLLSDIENGKGKRAFLEDLREARSGGITGFPTFLIRNRVGEELIIYGYHGFEAFERAFQRLATDKLVPTHLEPTDENILGFIRRYGKVAPREVAEVFNIPGESARESLRRLKSEALVKEVKVGNGFFYMA
ncbi:MAG: DsbA family protein [Candidatus Hydrothermarchaeales archaeon]